MFRKATIAGICVSKKTVACAPEAAFDFFKICEHELENQRQLTAMVLSRE